MRMMEDYIDSNCYYQVGNYSGGNCTIRYRKNYDNTQQLLLSGGAITLVAVFVPSDGSKLYWQ